MDTRPLHKLCKRSSGTYRTKLTITLSHQTDTACSVGRDSSLEHSFDTNKVVAGSPISKKILSSSATASAHKFARPSMQTSGLVNNETKHSMLSLITVEHMLEYEYTLPLPPAK